MIRALVDAALKNRLMVVGIAGFLILWGAISFKNLPIDAYPDVANNYVNIITQWPGHSAEDIEKQVTVPTEIQMAGLPHLDNLRSFTLAGMHGRAVRRNRQGVSIPAFSWREHGAGPSRSPQLRLILIRRLNEQVIGPRPDSPASFPARV